MLKKLDLEKLWKLCNRLSEKQSDLSEQSVYVYFMGYRSDYSKMSLEGFLEYYSFRVEGNSIIVFNDDGVAWESFTNNDFSYIPSVLLSFGEKELEKYIEEEIEKQLKQQEEAKIVEKEDIKRQIELLTKKLNNHA